MEIAIVLGLLAFAVIVFSTEKISVDIVTLLILIVLVLTKILTPKEAFEGFGSDFILMLGSIFVISAALQYNGIIDLMGSKLVKTNTTNIPLLITIIMLASGILSAFMNNTTIAAIFLPPIVSVARQLKISPSKLLMPMAFAALLGGTCTLIGTSTNVAGSAYMTKVGLQPMEMFELLPLGAILFIIGIIYMATIGKWWLPDHKDKDLTDEYDIRKYLSEVVVTDSSPLVGQNVFRSDLSALNVRVIKIIREGQQIFPDRNTLFYASDMVIVEGNKDNLSHISRTSGLDVLGISIDDKDLQSDDVKLAEIVVMPQSGLVNSTLIDAEFRKKYNLSVLAIHRKNYSITENIGQTELHIGDVLLAQGKQESIDSLKKGLDLVMIDALDSVNKTKIRKGWLTLSFFVTAIILSSIKDIIPALSFISIPASVGFLMAAVLTVLTGCLEGEKAYNAIDWRLLVLIGGMTAFGVAMKNTGADKFLAEQVVYYLQPFGTMTILFGFMVLTVLLTQPMSNAAAAMVVLPIAIETAKSLHLNERTFAIAIIVAASISMITPFEPACILVYGPGRYKIADFLKIGGLLTFVLLLVMLFIIPRMWGL
jgi:di/tricarboxylate transporter